MTPELVVLDASVGVKWIRSEDGSADALELLDAHGDSAITLAVPDVFVYEVLDVARRLHGRPASETLWQRLSADGPLIVPTDPSWFTDILGMARRLDCALYDAAAPALAERFGGSLVSADSKAHAAFPGVRLIG